MISCLLLLSWLAFSHDFLSLHLQLTVVVRLTEASARERWLTPPLVLPLFVSLRQGSPVLARVFKILDLTLTIKYVHEKSFRNGMLRHGIRVQKIVVVKVCTVRGAKALYLQLGLLRCDIRRLSRSLARSHVSIDCQRSRVELAMSAPLFTCALPA